MFFSRLSNQKTNNLKLRSLLTLITLLVGFTASVQAVRAATITVPAGGDLQTALNAAQAGDTILLEAGATYTGSFVLPVKPAITGTDSDYITIRTSTSDSLLPSSTTRLNPALHGTLLARLVSPGQGQPVIRTSPGAHHYRFLGLEFSASDSSSQVYDLLLFGDGSSSQNTLSQVPHHLIIDRCYLHALAGQELKRGVSLQSGETWIINSWLSDFKSAEQDSQAICGWNGPGPYHIVNNYVEAAGENILLGGADPWINQLVPSDIEIRGNTITKRLSWKEDDAGYGGQKWVVKNLLELKNAQRVVIDGNVIENCWRAAQGGTSIVLTPRNQDGRAVWSVVREVRISNNVIRHTNQAVGMLGQDDGHQSQVLDGVEVSNNLVYDVDKGRWGAGQNGGYFLSFVGPGAKNISIKHNTVVNADTGLLFETNVTLTNLVIADNFFHCHILGGGSGGTKPLNDYAVGGWQAKRNAIVIEDSHDFWVTVYPQDNFYPRSFNEVGFVDPTNSNFQLAASSSYKSQASDGKDVGCDFDKLTAAQNSSSAPPTPTPTPTPTPVPTPTPSITPTPTPTTSPTPSAGSPFKGSPFAVAGRIEVEDFNNGSEGDAYHDLDAVNTGGQYRTGGVDVRAVSAASNGYVVFNAYAGEWLRYMINVTATGNYDLGVSVASRLDGGTFHLEVDGVNVTGPIKVPATDSWATYKTVGKSGIRLNQGPHVLRLVLDSNGIEGVVADFDAINITPPLTSPSLISAALATAITLSSNANATADQIAPLVTGIEQAYAVFVSESRYFSSADKMDKGVRAALYFTRAAYALATVDGPSAKVQNRLQIAAAFLDQVQSMMQSASSSGSSAQADLYGDHATSLAITSPVIGLADTRSSASFAPVVAPASAATIIGDPSQSPLSMQTATASLLTSGKLPYEMAGVSVTVGGRAAQVLSVSPSRISFFVPADLPAGDAEVIVTLEAGYVSRGMVTIAAVAPGIFTKTGNGTGEAVAFDSNGFRIGPFDTQAPNMTSQDKRARLILFTTGLSNGTGNSDISNDVAATGGAIANLAESVSVEARTGDGKVYNLTVEYAGAQGACPGLEQVNVVVPSELKGAGVVELTLITGTLRSNTATVSIK